MTGARWRMPWGLAGSMIWFGSSAGVAVSNLFPEAKSVGAWLRDGWYVVVGYVSRLCGPDGHPRVEPGTDTRLAGIG
jgi:hypothetical protein